LLKRPEANDPALDAPRETFKPATGGLRIVWAFRNSLAGLQCAWRDERAFREEILLAIVLVPVACLVPVMPVERALLIGSMLLVIVVELLNTSVEAAIDRISLDVHPLSKRAKDLGSAAVLVALALLGVVWAVILAPRLFG
jgi:diacylglycerol kinase (ATP)